MTVERARSPSRLVATKMRSGVGVARVAQQLDDDVLDAADVVLGLPALGLGDLEADEAVAKVLLDLDVGVAGDGGDEVQSRRRES